MNRCSGNSPAFQRWVFDHESHQVPQGRKTRDARLAFLSSLKGLRERSLSEPSVETLGYFRNILSLNVHPRDPPAYAEASAWQAGLRLSC